LQISCTRHFRIRFGGGERGRLGEGYMVRNRGYLCTILYTHRHLMKKDGYIFIYVLLYIIHTHTRTQRETETVIIIIVEKYKE
jgi:uncharacterized membrane protein